MNKESLVNVKRKIQDFMASYKDADKILDSLIESGIYKFIPDNWWLYSADGRALSFYEPGTSPLLGKKFDALLLSNLRNFFKTKFEKEMEFLTCAGSGTSKEAATYNLMYQVDFGAVSLYFTFSSTYEHLPQALFKDGCEIKMKEKAEVETMEHSYFLVCKAPTAPSTTEGVS